MEVVGAVNRMKINLCSARTGTNIPVLSNQQA
jgi:hypothetical protein